MMQASLLNRCAVAPSSIDRDVLVGRSDYGAKATIRQRIRIIRVAIIECVPNISEGRRVEVVGRVVDAVRRIRGARLLDYSSDASHNRSVITIAGGAAPLKDAVLAIFETALADIDLRLHKGEHPRLGAVDVVPFIPIEGVTMEDCIALAQETARSVA